MLNVLSLFSGAGGFDLGFEYTGLFRTLACLDSDEDCIHTLQTNKNYGLANGTHRYLERAVVSKADLADPTTVLGLIDPTTVDVIIGGPPCQSFSVMGKRKGLEDMRGGLVFSFMTVVESIRPRAFVFENVPGFMTMNDGQVLSSVLEWTNRLGYKCWFGKLRASEYGDATVRVRFFLVAVMNPSILLVEPEITHGNFGNDVKVRSSSVPHHHISNLKSFVSVADALFGLDDPLSTVSPLNGHVAVAHRPEVIDRFNALRPGERDEARRRNRLRNDSPALTLFSGGVKGKKQARSHIHPTSPRELTPRECARIHGFPDYWFFCGGTDSILTQVSNSVPVHLGSAVGRMVAAACGELHDGK